MDEKYQDRGKGNQVELPSNYPEDITVWLRLPDGGDELKIDLDLTPAEIDAAQQVDPPFTPFRIISFFKIRDQDGQVVTEFDPPLELEYRYTYNTWFENSEQKFWQEKERPRVYYLEKIEDYWADRWEEFPDKFVSSQPPEDQNSQGLLTVTIPELPDPRIGGC